MVGLGRERRARAHDSEDHVSDDGLLAVQVVEDLAELNKIPLVIVFITK